MFDGASSWPGVPGDSTGRCGARWVSCGLRSNNTARPLKPSGIHDVVANLAATIVVVVGVVLFLVDLVDATRTE